MPFVTTISH